MWMISDNNLHSEIEKTIAKMMVKKTIGIRTTHTVHKNVIKKLPQAKFNQKYY